MLRVFFAPNLHKNLCAVFSVIPPFQMEKLMLTQCCHLGSYVLGVSGSAGVACPLGTVCPAGLNPGDPEPSTSQLFCLPDPPCFEAEDLPGGPWVASSVRERPCGCLSSWGVENPIPATQFTDGETKSQQERLSCHKWWQDMPSFPFTQAWCP